jgi:hypothetical protein
VSARVLRYDVADRPRHLSRQPEQLVRKITEPSLYPWEGPRNARRWAGIRRRLLEVAVYAGALLIALAALWLSQ